MNCVSDFFSRHEVWAAIIIFVIIVIIYILWYLIRSTSVGCSIVNTLQIKAYDDAEKTSTVETDIRNEKVSETSLGTNTHAHNSDDKKSKKTKSNSTHGHLVTADQYYYLPTASLTIKATAKVIITTTTYDDGTSKISASLAELQFENTVVIEPDTTQLFALEYNPFGFANDELRLTTNSSNLLENISVTAEDRISNIIGEIAATPKNLFTTQSVTPGREGPKIVSITIEAKVYNNIFYILTSEIRVGSFERDWKINVDTTSVQPINPVDASFKCEFNSFGKIYRGLNLDTKVEGILTRPLRKVKFKVDLKDTDIQMPVPINYEITIPDHSVTILVPITRAHFVKKIQTPKFSNGLLIENYINKPSEVEAALSIPINILKAIFSIPAQLLSFKIAHITQETSLETAKQNLAKAQLLSKQNDSAKDAQLLKTKLETEKIAIDSQKDILNANKDFAKAKTDWDNKKNELNDLLKSVNESRRNSEDINVPEDILIEAIQVNGDRWTHDYGLESIGVGTKKVNGLLTNINCLIFKPSEKIDKVDLDPLKQIPITINYQSISGKIYDLPTDVQATGGKIKASYIKPLSINKCQNENIKNPGCSVSRLSSDTAGTIGIKVYKNQKAFILSCYHILCDPELNNDITVFSKENPVGNTKIISPSLLDGGQINNDLGNTVEGQLDDFLDCAIAELTDSLYVDENISIIERSPKKILVIDMSHVQAQYKVQMVGRTSGYQSGYITSSYCDAFIDYIIKGKTVTKKLQGLISTTRISDAGDSGAPVIDESGNIIGIVVATVIPTETYIIPITRILSSFNLNLKN